MGKYKYIFFLFQIISEVEAQNCPIGYELRTIKCNKEFIQKCVPINYICKQCWAVSFPPCPNRKSGGLDFYSSYEKALARAESEKNKKWYCNDVPWWDNHNPTIYLDESNFCNLSLNGDRTVINDLFAKIKLLKKRYSDEKSNYKSYLKGEGYIPGTVIKEYHKVLKQSEASVKRLSINMNSITDANLAKIEAEFNEAKIDYENLKSFTLKMQGSKDGRKDKSWIKLKDNSYYRILPDGKYSFFDGISKFETVSPAEGKLIYLKHQTGKIRIRERIEAY